MCLTRLNDKNKNIQFYEKDSRDFKYLISKYMDDFIFRKIMYLQLHFYLLN